MDLTARRRFQSVSTLPIDSLLSACDTLVSKVAYFSMSVIYSTFLELLSEYFEAKAA